MSLPTSPMPAGTKRRHSPTLSLDLSDLPPLTTPSNPSNTLIITNLTDPTIFSPHNLQAIRSAIQTQAPLHSFSPLKSFRRIISTFLTVSDATHVRQLLDGELVLSNRIRVYFGEPTALEKKDRHLAAPQAQKLFFISPPPSPPAGWEMRNEDPPNKEVHADDLATALDRLNARVTEFPPSPATSVRSNGRSRSGTLVFDPKEDGCGEDLPSIEVEDTGEMEMESAEKKILAHTARPPVELMEH